MRHIVIALASAALIATAAGAAAWRDHGADAQRDLAKALAGHVAGKTVECIDPKMTDGPQIIGHDTLLYRGGGTIYKTTVIGPCPSLEQGVTVINDIYGGQLCRNDKFRTIEPGMTIPSNYCRLGAFTEYTPVKR
jgi:hypothetical protein